MGMRKNLSVKESEGEKKGNMLVLRNLIKVQTKTFCYFLRNRKNSPKKVLC
jgi:hypothetical protein